MVCKSNRDSPFLVHCVRIKVRPCWARAKAQAVFCCGKGQAGGWEGHSSCEHGMCCHSELLWFLPLPYPIPFEIISSKTGDFDREEAQPWHGRCCWAVWAPVQGQESDGEGHWFVLAPQASPQYLSGSGADNALSAWPHCLRDAKGSQNSRLYPS